MSARSVVERYLNDVLGGKKTEAEMLVSDEELLRRTAALHMGFPDLAVRVSALLGDGNLVAAHFRASGTHLGLVFGVPPTGRQCEASCTAVYRVEDERIADAWVTWDTLSLMEQLGAIERVQTVSA